MSNIKAPIISRINKATSGINRVSEAVAKPVDAAAKAFEEGVNQVFGQMPTQQTPAQFEKQKQEDEKRKQENQKRIQILNQFINTFKEDEKNLKQKRVLEAQQKQQQDQQENKKGHEIKQIQVQKQQQREAVIVERVKTKTERKLGKF